MASSLEVESISGGRVSGKDPVADGQPPRRSPRIREFHVKDEVVLVAPREASELYDRAANNRAVSLNRSGRAIWELCDGSRSVHDIVSALEGRFPVDRRILARQVDETLAKVARLGFLDGLDPKAAAGPGTTFVVGIEDKPYFLWQTAIFLESLRDKLPKWWRPFVVVCNDREPISDELDNILSRYEANFAFGTNYAKARGPDMGSPGGYAALNRVEALSVAAEHVDAEDVICLLDSDTFVFGEINIDIMPRRCAAPRNWHVEHRPFFASIGKNQGRGVDLGKLLEAIGCEGEFKPGGVNVFVTGEVAKNRKFISDCFRFAEALLVLGRIAGAGNVWMAEMPCFTLAMTANGVDWDLLERKEFLVSSCKEPSIPPGTIYHYYSDPADFGEAAFLGSQWHKQAYRNENFLLTEFGNFAADANTDHEKYFFQLALNARERLYD